MNESSGSPEEDFVCGRHLRKQAILKEGQVCAISRSA
jgi:hypothetical protein